MRLRFIADMHISPLTVETLQNNGYDVIRVTDKLPATASDTEIVKLACQGGGGNYYTRPRFFGHSRPKRSQ